MTVRGTAAHEVHADHPHIHSESCGHPTVEHGDHLDYVHEGHWHHRHGDHWDECPPEVTAGHGMTGGAPLA